MVFWSVEGTFFGYLENLYNFASGIGRLTKFGGVGRPLSYCGYLKPFSVVAVGFERLLKLVLVCAERFFETWASTDVAGLRASVSEVGLKASADAVTARNVEMLLLN